MQKNWYTKEEFQTWLLLFIPGDFVTIVKQINSQTDLIWMRSLPASLTIQSDRLSTLFQFEILVFSIFTIFAKLDPITCVGARGFFVSDDPASTLKEFQVWYNLRSFQEPPGNWGWRF